MIASGIGTAIADGALHAARLFAPARMAPAVDVTGRTFVVTGASPGSLGYEVARTLACWGGEVVATCRRDPAALKRSLTDGVPTAAARDRVTAGRLDLADRASVEAFARSTEEQLRGAVARAHQQRRNS